MLAGETLDAVFNLTPAPLHGAVNREILEAGVACFSEKPLASTLADADALIDLAASQDVLFLVAPGSAATAQMRWLTASSTTAISAGRRSPSPITPTPARPTGASTPATRRRSTATASAPSSTTASTGCTR